jgi:hypothetical protein
MNKHFDKLKAELAAISSGRADKPDMFAWTMNEESERRHHESDLADINRMTGENYPDLPTAAFWLNVAGWSRVWGTDPPPPESCWLWRGPYRYGKPALYAPGLIKQGMHAIRFILPQYIDDFEPDSRIRPKDTCQYQYYCVNPDHWELDTRVSIVKSEMKREDTAIKALRAKHGARLLLLTRRETRISHVKPALDGYTFNDKLQVWYRHTNVLPTVQNQPTHALTPMQGMAELSDDLDLYYDYKTLSGAVRRSSRDHPQIWQPTLWLPPDLTWITIPKIIKLPVMHGLTLTKDQP